MKFITTDLTNMQDLIYIAVFIIKFFTIIIGLQILFLYGESLIKEPLEEFFQYLIYCSPNSGKDDSFWKIIIRKIKAFIDYIFKNNKK